MKNIKTLIIDDERLAREELKSLLNNYPFIEIIGEAKNGREGITLTNKLQPDLLFLDINMPEISGFDLINQLEEIPMVVFITAYDEYAIKAFEVNALDYILKPIDQNRLSETIQKIKNKYTDEVLEENSDNSPSTNKLLTTEDSIFIKDGEKSWFIELSKVRLFESEGNYVKVHFDENRPMILRSLGSVEERLDANFFFRANRKHIVNLKWIHKIENWFNGGLMLHLKTGESIEVSRRQALKFKEMWSL